VKPWDSCKNFETPGCTLSLLDESAMHGRFEAANPKVKWPWRLVSFAIVPLLLARPAVTQTQDAAQHFKDFTHSVISPRTVLMPGASSAFSQFVTKPAGFDPGAKGYGEHYGVALADNVSSKFIRDFGFPVVFRQDVKYVPDQPNTGVWRRVGHACLHSVIVGTDKRQLNFSGVPASFAAAGVSNLYQPQEQRTWSATLQRTGTNAGGYVLGDLASEFSPELCALRKKLHLGFGCK
jgi:hypothetical protein